MSYLITITIIVLLILLIDSSVFHEKKSCSNLDGNCYKIVKQFKNSKNAADELAKINIFNAKLINYMRNKYLRNGNSNPWNEQMAAITKQLINNYNPNVLKENNPNSVNNTSYVLEKGVSVAFCLREKNSGNNEIENDKTLEFVNLHEISHLAMSFHDPNHGPEFWKVFKLIQNAAFEAGLYKPVNYTKTPITYCGVNVNYNPFFDDNLVV